jgi:ADP-ribose pyrophosphatase YjhB (NUDIX family)
METIQRALIINPDEKFLLIKNKNTGKWTFPGGQLDPDEMPSKDLINEVKSRIGLDVEVIYQFFSSMMKEGEKQIFNVAYLCRLKDAAKIKLGDDYSEFKWAKIGELKKLKLENDQIVEMADKAMVVLGGGGE